MTYTYVVMYLYEQIIKGMYLCCIMFVYVFGTWYDLIQSMHMMVFGHM